MSETPTDKLFIGNLAWATDNQGLLDLFSKYGSVKEAVVIMDRDNPTRSRGYGFVTMSSTDEAKAAKDALNGYNLDDREIRIDYAQPKEAGFKERPSYGDKSSSKSWDDDKVKEEAPVADEAPAADEVAADAE